jgi:hypothetical protein
VFLLFVGYGVLFVVFHKVLAPRSKVYVERCFLDFLWLCVEDNVELLNGGWGTWWWRGINTGQG